jgi:lysophospholipase L1-like esterase
MKTVAAIAAGWARRAIPVLVGLSICADAVPAADKADKPAATSQQTAAVAGRAAKLVLKKGDRLAIAGDSITEQRLYCRYIEDYLAVCLPRLELWSVQLGWSGETAGGFLGRVDIYLRNLQPTVMTTCYGMNDGGYRPYADSIGAGYEKNMKGIVAKAKAAGTTVILGSPGAVDTKYYRGGGENANVYNDNLAHLRDIAQKVATEEGLVFADVHTPMTNSMELAKAALETDFSVCGRDGVHPEADGHVIMAYAFLKAMGLDGEIGTFTVDMNGSAEATEGHKILSVKDGVVEIESRRYPFCFFGDAKSPNSTRSILPYVPFNETLNRLMLVVTNLNAEKAKVAWGAAGKTFTREQLTKGINLAAEFLDNPFCDSFKKVDELVGKKQSFETGLTKGHYMTMRSLEAEMGGDAEGVAAVKTIIARLNAKHTALQEGVRAAVVPVKHTIAITAE